jgi:hypothetical protein
VISFPGRRLVEDQRRRFTNELVKAIDTIGSDVNWRERLNEYFRENASDLWTADDEWEMDDEWEDILFLRNDAINNAIKTLKGKHDADTVALWTERLKALKKEFAKAQKRRHAEELKIAKAKEEAAKAKEESTLIYRLGNAINRWALRFSGHDVDTNS